MKAVSALRSATADQNALGQALSQLSFSPTGEKVAEGWMRGTSEGLTGYVHWLVFGLIDFTLTLPSPSSERVSKLCCAWPGAWFGVGKKVVWDGGVGLACGA